MESLYYLSNDVMFDFGSNYIVVRDQTNQEDKVRIFLGGNTIQYQLYDANSGQWQQTQSITPPVVSDSDSITLPHNAGSNYIQIDGDGLQLVQSTIQRFYTNGTKFFLNAPMIQFADSQNSPVIKYNGAQGQQFKVMSNDNILLSLNTSSLSLSGQQLFGLSDSIDPTSAVTRQYLTGQFKPGSIQMGSSGIIPIYNQASVSIIEISSLNLTSTIKLKYSSLFQSFQPDELVNSQYVIDKINQQVIQLMGQANGITPLDSLQKVSYQYMQGDLIKLSSGLQSINGINITTDYIPQGLNRKYYDDQLVNQVITQQKGVVNGLCPLDAQGKVSSTHLPALQSGQVFSGLDANKTSPGQYPSGFPSAGDKYIATDTQLIYVLATAGYQISANWIQVINPSSVVSVNGLTGVVNMTTDNITEGVNTYFANGMSSYLTNQSNTSGNLLKLDGLATINKNFLQNPFQIKNGSVQLLDDQSGTLYIQNAASNDNLMALNSVDNTSYKILKYDSQKTFTQNTQLVSKDYVDTGINNSSKISKNNIQLVANDDSQLVASYGANQLLSIDNNLINSNRAITYDNSVLATDDQQLINKKYVDDAIRNITLNIGLMKQYLQVQSNQIVQSNGLISQWNMLVQSSSLSRIVANNDGTFTVNMGTYRIYLGLQISDGISGGSPITVAIKSVDQTTTYFDFVSTNPGNDITQTYPILLYFPSNVNFGIYATRVSSQERIIKSYFMIEEFDKQQPAIGQDMISDVSGLTKVRAIVDRVDTTVQNSLVVSHKQQRIEIQDGVKIVQPITTTISEQGQLVTKKYVDDALNIPTFSVSKLGQIAQLEMSADQIASITAGTNVLFNVDTINTATTISLLPNGIIQLTGGFIYRIDYQISVKFGSGYSIIIFAFVDHLQAEAPKSRQYSQASQASLDSSSDGASFLLDLTALVGTKTFSIQARSVGGTVQRIYHEYTRLVIQQIQELNDINQDRIQNVSQSAYIKVDGDQFKIKSNSQEVAILQNNNGAFRISDANNTTFVDMQSNQSVPILFKQKAGLDAGVAIDQTNQFVTKQYTDDSFAPINPQGLIPVQYIPDTVAIGIITALYGSSIPTNWLLCDGSTFDQSTYPELYTFLGNTNILPNLKGYFLRGLDTSGTVDNDGAGRTIGSIQQDSLETHTHNVTYDRSNQTTDEIRSATDNNRTYMNNYTATTVTSTATGSAETRPKNIAVNYIIKAKRDGQFSQTPNYSQIVNTTQATKIQALDADQLQFDINSAGVLNISSSSILASILLKYNSYIAPSSSLDIVPKQYVDQFQKDFCNIYSPIVVENSGMISGFVLGTESTTQGKITFNGLLSTISLQPGQYQIYGNFITDSTQPTSGQSYSVSIDMQNASTQVSLLPFTQLWSAVSYQKGDTNISNQFTLNVSSLLSVKFVFLAAPDGRVTRSNITVNQL